MAKKIIDYNEHIKRTQIGRRKNRRGNMTPVYMLLSAVIIVVAVTLCLTVFFRIKEFSITGSDRYTGEEIIAATGLKGDENLFRIDKEKVAHRLESTLLYIESVEVKADFPDTLQIKVTQAEPFAAVESDGGYYVVSKNGKVIEKVENASVPGNLARLEGVTVPEKALQEYAGGTEIPRIEFPDEKSAMAYWDILKNLERRNISSVSEIMTGDYLSLNFVIDGRIRVYLGSSVDIEYKMRYVERILQEKKDETRFIYINVSSTEKAIVRTVTDYDALWADR